MRIIPVRHHSPGNAWHLASAIRATRPRCVLIEGPSDANHLAVPLLAPDTEPPVAILAYYPATDSEPPLAALWPFSAYSPEWVALTVGQEVGAEIRFIDAPAGLALKRRAAMRARLKERDEARPETAPEQPLPKVLGEVARQFGFDSYGEFWESRFEMAPGAELGEAMLSFGELVREQPAPEPGWEAYNAQREAWMRAQIRRALDDGFSPDEMMVVCGAAHAPALGATRQDGDEASVSELEALDAARLTIIPYSFLRLSEQVGYGAGNHAPAYYQSVWEQGLDFGEATQATLIKVGRAMQEAGFVVSTADIIEANRLARSLAGLREKPMPGYYEMREAVEACYGRGQVNVDTFLIPITVGDAVGRISQQVERTTVQEEFYTTVSALGLPLSDSAAKVTLHLTDEKDVEASIFLYRLDAVQIPYGHLRRSGPTLSRSLRAGSLLRRIGGGRQNQPPNEEGAHLLGRLQEEWSVQWTPATDISLIEKSIQGNTLEDICRRVFRERLEGARNVGEASEVLLRVVLAGLASLYDEALDVCERISAHDEDFEAQAHAAQKLQLLLTYGSARALDEAPIAPLLAKVFTRGTLLLPGAAAVGDEAAAGVVEGIKTLYEVARQTEQADEALLYERLGRTLDAEETHPVVKGLCVALLFLGERLSEEEMLRWLNFHLTSRVAPMRGAQFLDGFLTLNRSVILRNPSVVGWLNAFVDRLSFASFVETLPVLRRAFASLSRAEVEYLASALLRVLGLSRDEAVTIGEALSEEEMAALNAEIGRRAREFGD